LRRVRLPNVTRLLHFPTGARAGNTHRESKILLRWKGLTVIVAAHARFTLLTSTEGVRQKDFTQPTPPQSGSALLRAIAQYFLLYQYVLDVTANLRGLASKGHHAVETPPALATPARFDNEQVTLAEAKFCYFEFQMLAHTASTQRTIQRNFYVHLPLAGYSTNTINESGVKPRVHVLAHLKQGFDGHVCRSCVQTSLTCDSASCKCFRETAAIWITNTISEAARQPKPKSMMTIHW
jgi:hypothetical protein